MQMISEIKLLLQKELILEWRSKFAISGVVLYVFSTIFVSSLIIMQVQTVTWNALFWVIMLFSAINAVSKSFLQESRGRQMYISGLASPASILVAKIIYNCLLMILLTLIAFTFYSFAFKMQAQDLVMYLVTIVLGSVTFSTLFTLVSAIASKAGNGGVLMAILSFPVIIPALIIISRLAKNAMDGLDRSFNLDEIFTLLIINVLAIVFSIILFPYLYKD